jgi:PAS domain-containing protein
MRSTLSSRHRVTVLYAGVAIFVALGVVTARSIAVAWRARGAEASAEAVLDLVGERTAPRPTAAPGAMAWLRRQLDRYERQIADPTRAVLYRSLVAPSARVPDALAPIATALTAAPTRPPDARPVHFGPVSPDTSSLRRERLVTSADRTFIVTRRRWLDADEREDTESNRLVRALVPILADRQAAIARVLGARPLPSVPDTTPPRPVRVYAVAEDGTLVSTPWASDGAAVTAEAAVLTGRAGLPSFAPEDFFFHFDPRAADTPPAYSGFYLDLGGRGLVSTMTAPVDLADGRRAIVAVDLAFDITWEALASGADAPVVGAAIRVADESPATWMSLETASTGAPAPLRQAVRALADAERQSGLPEDAAPLRHALVPTGGAVAAFQVSDRVWLLMFFPPAAPTFPLAAVAFLVGVLVVLLSGFEVNRRRAEGERQKAEGALAEKQNLLNTMQVPLVVVDPNSDVIVSANRAAEGIGIRAGARFADLVWPDARSRAHYAKMQVASPEPRRAYGLPVTVRGADGQVRERYAVVRSVAVTAPIEALSADERHRLGVLFVLDEEDDLALFAEVVDARAHREERQRLAGLLTHGVDTLARVLEHCLVTGPTVPARLDFSTWLAEYLERRLTVTAWLLDHWDAVPPLPRDQVVDVGHVRATLDRLEAVVRFVRDDRELRARLHWANGTLSAEGPEGRVFDRRLGWPPSVVVTVPVRGGVGMFLGEVVTNAVRHGLPGSVISIDIVCDPVRRELEFRIENQTADRRTDPPAGEAYGGLAMLGALARLFEWRDLSVSRADGRFLVSWRVPASVGAPEGQAD